MRSFGSYLTIGVALLMGGSSVVLAEGSAAPQPASNTVAPAADALGKGGASDITIETDEASYIRKLHSLRRDLELTKIQSDIAEQKIKIAEANRKIKKALDGEDDAPDEKQARRSSVTPNIGEENAAGFTARRPAPPADVASDADDARASKPRPTGQAQPPPPSLAMAMGGPPRVVSIINEEAQMDFHGDVGTYRAGDEFEGYRVIRVDFDSVLLETPDGSRKQLGVSWSHSN